MPRLSRIIHCNPTEGSPTHIRIHAHTPCRAAGEVEVKELASVTARALVSSAEPLEKDKLPGLMEKKKTLQVQTHHVHEKQ